MERTGRQGYSKDIVDKHYYSLGSQVLLVAVAVAEDIVLDWRSHSLEERQKDIHTAWAFHRKVALGTGDKG